MRSYGSGLAQCFQSISAAAYVNCFHAKYNYIIRMYYLFIYISGHLALFYFSSSTHDVAINICIQFPKWTYGCIYLGYSDIPRSRAAKAYGNFMFNLWKNLQPIFQSHCIIACPIKGL